ncbi:unnamed protein product [Hymenolepis diminuta]|uniref:Uncharacterized protein n=1 Tax=Hymenolepis diminuta TaxID=6216 RepID=A0A564Y2M8_HYMDI|nr:unnamed protein product [Hymenolepis diminuta]
MFKCEATKWIQVSAEKRAVLLHHRRYHRSSDVMIQKDFNCPISDCFKSYKRYRW